MEKTSPEEKGGGDGRGFRKVRMTSRRGIPRGEGESIGNKRGEGGRGRKGANAGVGEGRKKRYNCEAARLFLGAWEGMRERKRSGKRGVEVIGRRVCRSNTLRKTPVSKCWKRRNVGEG